VERNVFLPVNFLHLAMPGTNLAVNSYFYNKWIDDRGWCLGKESFYLWTSLGRFKASGQLFGP
jgi:hypothetical protein